MYERHGLSHTRLHKIWRGLIERCYNPKNPSYEHYGGRGIQVCPEWRENFMAFYNWAKENGEYWIYQIDRIDNDGDYSPDNCRWVSPKDNIRNSGVVRRVEAFGETKSLIEWAEDERCKTSYPTLCKRFSYGWQPEKAISTPSRNYWRL